MVASPEGGVVTSATAAARQQAVGPRHLARVELRLGLEAPLPGGLRGRKGLGVAQAQFLDPGHGHVRRLVVQTLIGLGQRVRGLGQPLLDMLLLGQRTDQLIERVTHRPALPMSSKLSSKKAPPSASGARAAPVVGRRYLREPRQPSPRALGGAEGLAGPPASRACGRRAGSRSCPTSALGSGVLTNRSQVGLPCLSGSPAKATTDALPSQPLM